MNPDDYKPLAAIGWMPMTILIVFSVLVGWCLGEWAAMKLVPIVIDQVGFRIRRWNCPNCDSDNLEIVWVCTKPEVLTYTCLDCKIIFELPV